MIRGIQSVLAIVVNFHRFNCSGGKLENPVNMVVCGVTVIVADGGRIIEVMPALGPDIAKIRLFNYGVSALGFWRIKISSNKYRRICLVYNVGIFIRLVSVSRCTQRLVVSVKMSYKVIDLCRISLLHADNIGTK